MRIRSRLLLLVAAVLVPAFIGAGIGVAYIYQEEQEFNYTSMRETARALAVSLDRDMARRQAMLRTLVASPSLQRDELKRFYGYASAVAKESDSAIILSDLQGRQLLNTRLAFGAPLPRMLPLEREFRARFGNEALLISGVYVPPAGLGPHSFAIQMPVRRNGEVVQFLAMASFAGQMQNLLAAQRLPPGWLATIIDHQGVVVARSQEPGKFVGNPARADLAAKIAGQAEGFHEGVTLEGVRSTAFFSRAPGSGWVFVLAVPHSALYGTANRATVLMGTISLLLLGLGLAAALIVARRISRPVEGLREAAQRLGRNEPVQAQSSGTLELDAVGEAMSDASERLREATAELERRVAAALASFEHSQRALLQAQKLEALGRLTGGIAHDFNNVLQTLTASLQVLKHGARPEQGELLARCQRAVARGTELARQLMAFGRVQEVRMQTIDTATRLSEARNLLGGALPANLRLVYDLPAGLWPVTVDPAQLELAVLNLVINARDAMRAGGSVVLRAKNETVSTARADLPAGEYVLLTVSDTGEGMSEEVLARALDPFYTTKGVGQGSGMGLPQAYGFARQNGGTLTLESRPGHGTTVTMYLPRARQPVSVRPSAPMPPALRAGKGKILLVEDDEQVRETVASGLKAAGFDIHTASTGDEALHRIEGGERYDAVLTDVVMPGKASGVDVAEHLRKHHPRTGVVMVTGYADRAVQLPGVRALAKPFDVEQAVEALNAAMAG
jgi:signal transduction histidine kinase/CheY-like chemotaxis protein